MKKMLALEANAHEAMLHTLGFFITMKCPLKCSHCAVSGYKKSSFAWDFDRVQQWFRDIKSTGFIRQVSITGGEPFIEFEKLISVVDILTHVGLESSVITSSYWAGDKAETKRLLGELAHHGLGTLCLSIGPYHQRQVPVNNIRNAILFSRDAGITTCLLYHYHGHKDPAQIIYELGELLGKDHLLYVDRVNYGTILAMGRAREGLGERFRRMHFTMDFCTSIVPVLFPDGAINACCGEMISDVSHTFLGNLSEYDFETILHRMRSSPILPAIAFIGFEKTVQRLKEQGIEIKGESDIPRYELCQRCKTIMSDERAVRIIKDGLLPEFKSEIGIKQLLLYGYHFFEY
jgi:hypothetical protein